MVHRARAQNQRFYRPGLWPADLRAACLFESHSCGTAVNHAVDPKMSNERDVGPPLATVASPRATAGVRLFPRLRKGTLRPLLRLKTQRLRQRSSSSHRPGESTCCDQTDRFPSQARGNLLRLKATVFGQADIAGALQRQRSSGAQCYGAPCGRDRIRWSEPGPRLYLR